MRLSLIALLQSILPPPEEKSEAMLKQKGDGDGQYIFARLCKEHLRELLEKDTAQSDKLAAEINAQRGLDRDEEGAVRPESCRLNEAAR